MARKETGIDFSKEDWDTAVEFFDGCWVIANKHNAGLNEALELNNRTFVFRLKERGDKQVLFVFGCGCQDSIEAVKRLEKQTGLPVAWVCSNGGSHHLFLDLWYQAFPNARVLVPAKRIPFTKNGKHLQSKYKDRWETIEGMRPKQIADAFGDQVDCLVFDQLFSAAETKAEEIFKGVAYDHTSERRRVGGFSLVMKFGKLSKDVSQPSDEVFFFHRASGLAISGHNFQFIFKPKDYSAPDKFKMSMGGFPMNFMMKMMMPKGSFKSALEGQPGPIADPARHAATWQAILEWDIKAWTSCHDVPTVCGPDWEGAQIKQAIRESIARSGEDDPTGQRLKWTQKHGRPQP